eukprot:148387_1
MGHEASQTTIVQLKSPAISSPKHESLSESVQTVSPITESAHIFPNNKTDSIEAKFNNGVTGQYLSISLAETAYVFWKKHIDRLPPQHQLEIGCSIYFTMMGSKTDVKQILWKQFKTDHHHNALKRLGFQFMNMMRWLIEHLCVNNIDLKGTLMQLGTAHKALGVNRSHLDAMLAAIHETFAYYFEYKYSIKEKYAMEKLFTVASKLMMHEEHHTNRVRSFDDLDFLRNLSACLKCDLGREYLYRFFEQTFCDELVIYLQSIRRFNAAVSDKERFMIARDICNASIKASSAFAINISYETRQQTVNAILELQTLFLQPVESKRLTVGADLFDECQREIMKLIKVNHWVKFKQQMIVLSQ